MDSLKPTDLPLDELAARARAGDTGAESALFAFLRERFLAVAKRRVRTDDLEDVVQDSISIVHAKLAGRRAEGTLLVWSFAVLRNVVGNY